MKDIRIIAGMLSPILSFAFIAWAIAIHPWFDWNENALSDLGAAGSSDAWVFNTGLILGGLLTSAYSTYLFSTVRGRALRTGAFVFLLASISMALIGVFPEGTSLHLEAAVLFYLLSLVAMLIFGVFFSIRQVLYRLMSLFLAFTGLLLASLPVWTSAAIPETIGAVAIAIWLYMTIYFHEKGGIEWTTGTE